MAATVDFEVSSSDGPPGGGGLYATGGDKATSFLLEDDVHVDNNFAAVCSLSLSLSLSLTHTHTHNFAAVCPRAIRDARESE